MFLGHLLFTLVFTWAVVQDVESRPSTYYAIDLPYCGTDGFPITECVSVCEPVRSARNCSGNVACTCASAPLAAVKACLQCQVDADPNLHAQELLFRVPPRLSAYAEVCAHITTFQDRDHSFIGSPRKDSQTTTTTPVVHREFLEDRCIYGLPRVTAVVPLPKETDRSEIWPVISFIIVIVLCILENCRHTS
ncbi:hypothetical protein AcV5_010104 [Taiwanofungus camphoratus]|nr:hypothetical protein AcV5_010104 [Antrodia cinnamomea]